MRYAETKRELRRYQYVLLLSIAGLLAGGFYSLDVPVAATLCFVFAGQNLMLWLLSLDGKVL